MKPIIIGARATPEMRIKRKTYSVFCVIKIVFHEKQLIFHSICPVWPGVSSGTGNKIVRNVTVHQLPVQVFIYFKKEIISATINNNSQ